MEGDMDRKECIGVIGCGNMGGALLAGWAAGGRRRLAGYTRTMARMAPLLEKGVIPCKSADELVSTSDYVILAVKPYQIKDVAGSLDAGLLKGKLLISLAAGIELATVSAACGGVCAVARCMPNTPAMVGEGVFALCFDDKATEAHKEGARELFAELGVCLPMPESRFTAFSALIGAGPAYVFELMEGMVMAGVTMGFQHAESRAMVEALFKGCACLAGASRDTHLIALRDNVCSPAGLTIAGVNRMCADGLAGRLAEAVFAAERRGREMEG